MPAPWVRTGSARLRPERSQTAQGADGHSPSGPCPHHSAFTHLLLTKLRLARNASSGLRPAVNSKLFPGRYRLAATIELAPWKIAPMTSVAAPRN